ncbi:UNVERIFIED_CONTAM: hypothetical protein FKN15_043958 [Acipenser sinensis]
MSTRLALFLLTQNTHITGTIRTNRGAPKEVTEEKLDKGQACFVKNSDLLLVRWHDKRDVNVMTTKYTAGFVEKTCVVTGGATVFFKKPFNIEKYNALMGAVDACNQDLEPYDPSRKSLAYWHTF